MKFLPRNLWVFVTFFAVLVVLMAIFPPFWVLAVWVILNILLFMLPEAAYVKLDDVFGVNSGEWTEAVAFLLVMPLVLLIHSTGAGHGTFIEVWLRVLRGEREA